MAETPETHLDLQLAELLDPNRTTTVKADVILVCGGKHFPAHKIVLSATSNYFRAMLAPGWDESGKGRIELPTITKEEMEIILTFFYTEKIEDVSDPSLLASLFKTSHMLEIKTLFEYCYKKLCEGLTSDSFLELFELAELYDEGMTKLVVSFLAQHFVAVSTSKEFLEMKAPHLKKVAQKLHMCTSSTDNIVKGLLRWAEVEEDRQATLLHILTILDLQDMSTKFLTELLRDRSLVKKNCHILTLLTAEATSRILASSTTEGKLLCFGKDGRQIFRMYDVSKNQWSVPQTLPFNLELGMSVVWFEEYVYIIGGGHIANNRNETQPFLPGDNTRPSTNVIKYNPATNRIVSVGKLTRPVCNAGTGVLFKTIYVVNGINEHSQRVRMVQRYNPTSDTCQAAAQTNHPYNQPQVLSHFNYLYLLAFSRGQNSIERYDPEFNEWTIVTVVPGVIEQCSAAIFSDRLFVVPSLTTNEFQVYDFATGTWVQKRIDGSPNKIVGLFSTTIKQKHILVVCDDKDALHSYDAASGLWVTKSKSSIEPWNIRQTCVI